MERVQKADDISRLKNAFHCVFSKSDPFSDPFHKTLSERVLIFPTKGYYLQENQFHALMKTIGESTFFVSESEGDSFNLSQDFHSELSAQHWIAENTVSYEGYQSMPLVVENALYSPQGEWGLQISHEDHAILAGNSLFIDSFKEAYPEWKEDKDKFHQYWVEANKEFSTDITWIHDFLKQF